jgi:hypothetical protein
MTNVTLKITQPPLTAHILSGFFFSTLEYLTRLVLGRMSDYYTLTGGMAGGNSLTGPALSSSAAVCTIHGQNKNHVSDNGEYGQTRVRNYNDRQIVVNSRVKKCQQTTHTAATRILVNNGSKKGDQNTRVTFYKLHFTPPIKAKKRSLLNYIEYQFC